MGRAHGKLFVSLAPSESPAAHRGWHRVPVGSSSTATCIRWQRQRVMRLMPPTIQLGPTARVRRLLIRHEVGHVEQRCLAIQRPRVGAAHVRHAATAVGSTARSGRASVPRAGLLGASPPPLDVRACQLPQPPSTLCIFPAVAVRQSATHPVCTTGSQPACQHSPPCPAHPSPMSPRPHR